MHKSKDLSRDLNLFLVLRNGSMFLLLLNYFWIIFGLFLDRVFMQ